MKFKKPKEIVKEFIKRINNADIQGIHDLMAENHIFIDISGEKHQGKDEINWQEFFRIFPDYRINIRQIIEKVNKIIIIGKSEGTFSKYGKELFSKNCVPPLEEDYQGKAIWTAKVREGLIDSWRIYLDNEQSRSRLKIQL